MNTDDIELQIKQPIKDPFEASWEKAIRDGLTPDGDIRPEVSNSWLYCRKINLDPYSLIKPSILAKNQLNKLLRLNRDLIEISKPVMQMIEISVRGTGFIVNLSDHRGYVLEVCGDKDVMKKAEKNVYTVGCLRSIDHAGTNAIGLCLVEKKPIQLTGAEHYKFYLHSWTCSSAPIRDSFGKIVGAITLSGRSNRRHQHTLALVTAAAETIETQLRERSLINEKQRLNSLLNSIYNSISDGIIAIDQQQKITHMNSIACKMLDIRNKSFIGRHLKEVVRPDQGMLQAINDNEYFEGHETRFRTTSDVRTYICSVSPIRNAEIEEWGMLIKLAEKRQMIKIAKRIGGNHAKYEFSDIKGNSPAIQQQIQIAKISAKTNSRVLIIGSSGSGKELFAQAIHNHSNRRNEPFVAISCAAIPRDLIESELFGYRGGAFTGARPGGMMGKFEFANKGTLFLDEINSLPIQAQAKLLRALQQNEIVRLGDNQTIRTDVRVVAASSVDLIKEVEKDNFREDLYYRLSVVEIFVPPLRERIEDLGLLVDHILRRQCEEFGFAKFSISEKTVKIMKDYHWPGNIRELENSLGRALMLSQGKTIEPEHLPMRARRESTHPPNQTIPMREGYRQMIETALTESNGNISKAARRLKVARSTLYRKMEEFGISS